MKLGDIFKMELFKNRNDKLYLLIIGILIAMTTISTFIGVGLIEDKVYFENNGTAITFFILIFFSGLGLWIFSLLYPFRLLSVDYKNRVMGLIFASGVSREKYYFVKISATILSCFIAIFAILLIPAVTFLFFYNEQFVKLMQEFWKGFDFANFFPIAMMLLFSLLAYYVTLTTAVIITKGKLVGILLYFGFSFAISIFQTMIGIPTMASTKYWLQSIGAPYYLLTLFSIIQIIIFGLIGLNVLKKQDL